MRPLEKPPEMLTLPLRLTAQVQKSASRSVLQCSGNRADTAGFWCGPENPNYTERHQMTKTAATRWARSSFREHSQPNGKLYLFETEGRNVAAIDSVTLVNGQFDFGSVEVGRGFYGLGFESKKKTGDIIMNPDEPVLKIDFQNARLIGGGTDSRENQGGLPTAVRRRPTRTRFASFTSRARAKRRRPSAMSRLKEDELARPSTSSSRITPGRIWPNS